jgi:hypothetical protein
MFVWHLSCLSQPLSVWPRIPSECTGEYYIDTISHPDIRVKYGSISAFTLIVVTLNANVFVYKTEVVIRLCFVIRSSKAVQLHTMEALGGRGI